MRGGDLRHDRVGGQKVRQQRMSLEAKAKQTFERVLSEVFRGFLEVFRVFLEVFRGPLKDPLRGRFPSQRLSVLLPLIVLPLEQKDPHPKISALQRKRPVLLRANFVLTKDRKRPYYRHFCGKMHREGSCSKAAGGSLVKSRC